MPLSNLPLCRAAAIVVLALVAFVVFIFSIAAIKSYTERPAVLRLSVLNHAFIMATNLVPAALWHSRIAGPMLDVDQMKEYALSVSGHISTDFLFDIDQADDRLAAYSNHFQTAPFFSRFGQVSGWEWMQRGLTNRLQLSGILKAAGEESVRGIPVTRPVFVTGLPRSGTTVFHRVLSASDDLRGLAWYEAMYPGGVGGTIPCQNSSGQRDARIGHATRMSVDSVEECVFLQANSIDTHSASLMSTAFTVPQGVPQNDTGVYELHKLQVQAQSWFNPTDERRWAFKAPAHVSRLDALLEVYPDAYIVWMHRDPLWVTTSYSLLLALFKRMNEDATSEQIAAFGPVVAARLKELIDEAMRVRDTLPPEILANQVIDVRYTDFVSDPVGTTCAVAERIGVSCDSIAEAVKDFGLVEEEVAALFREYTDRFDLPLGGSRYPDQPPKRGREVEAVLDSATTGGGTSTPAAATAATASAAGASAGTGAGASATAPGGDAASDVHF